MAPAGPADAGTKENNTPSISGNDNNLASLTDEILLEILNCVSPLEVLCHVCRVSKRLAAITTSQDTDLRFWRYHPRLPRSLKERIQGDGDREKKKAGKSGTNRNHGEGGKVLVGALSLKLDRRQIQMLVCICTNAKLPSGVVAGATAADGVLLPRLLRRVDLLPSQEAARATSVEIYGGLMLRRQACLASSQDHEHEDVKRVLRHARKKASRDDEVIQRLHGRAGMRRHQEEEDSDENGGGGGDTTDDADEDDDEQIRQGLAVPRASQNMEPNPSYDALWEYISREEPDLGPPHMNGHIDLGFFMRVMRQEGSYYSSEPSQNRDTNESLLFAAQGCQHSLITDVAIKPFRELRLDEDHVAYTWPKAVVSVYSLPDVQDHDEEDDEGDEEDDNRKTSVWSCGNVTEPPSSALERQRRQNPFFPGASHYNPIASNAREDQGRGGSPPSNNLIPDVLAGHTPVYTSAPRECDATNTGWQHFSLPPGVVGNVVVFTLQGKYNRQYPESGYYVCCERVECRGVPLWSVNFH